jgi:hypothetical protein
VTITDQAAAAGLGVPPDWSFSAAVVDINGDGWPDLFVPIIGIQPTCGSTIRTARSARLT